MALYTGINGVVREIKQLFTGVNGVVREIVEEYCGVDGVVRKIFSAKQFIELVSERVNYTHYSGLHVYNQDAGEFGVEDDYTYNNSTSTTGVRYSDNNLQLYIKQDSDYYQNNGIFSIQINDLMDYSTVSIDGCDCSSYDYVSVYTCTGLNSGAESVDEMMDDYKLIGRLNSTTHELTIIFDAGATSSDTFYLVFLLVNNGSSTINTYRTLSNLTLNK